MSIPGLEVWAQFGLAGLVIAVLFFFLWRIAERLFARFDKSIEEHAKERKSWYDTLEIRDARQAKRDENLERALREVATGLRASRAPGDHKDYYQPRITSLD